MNDISQFKKGIELSLKNAETWLNESNLLYDQGSYGHCCALLVHGAEALAQAYKCWEVYNGLTDPSAPDILDAFKHHRPKLDALFGFLVGNYALGKIISEPHYHPIAADIDKEKALVELKRFVKNSEKFYDGIMELRNSGIYINYDHNKHEFLSPLEASRETADFTVRLVYVVYWSVLVVLNSSEDQIAEYRKQRQQIESRFKDILE